MRENSARPVKPHKDVYITETLKDLLVEFLCKKTGLEWYMFRRSSEIMNAIKPYFLEAADCFYESSVSFDGREQYESTLSRCLRRTRKTFRLTFVLEEEDREKIRRIAEDMGFGRLADLYSLILFSLTAQGKPLTASLRDFADFFYSQKSSILLEIPGVIAEKLERTDYRDCRQMFYRRAFFWQMRFGETPSLRYEDEEYYRVTSQKTGWRSTMIVCSEQLKEFARNRNLGSTNCVVLANALNAYLDAEISAKAASGPERAEAAG